MSLKKNKMNPIPDQTNSFRSDIRFFTSLTVGLSLFVIIVSLLGGNVDKPQTEELYAGSAEPEVKKEFPAVVLQANAAYVYDARTHEVLFAVNEERRMPLASIT